MSVPIFHRTKLAENIVNRVLSPKGLSGIFISANRRTGKSTLVKEDMLPYLETLGVESIYVDLWQNRDRDPGELISEAIEDHIKKREGAILKWARKGGLEKVTVGGIEVDVNKVGIGKGKSFSKALAELSDATKKMIVLVIDEAQHAITTPAGATALFSLKAARDELNGSSHYGFRLIATGSNRDKLMLLAQGKDQAFMGAVTLDLDPLGKDYVAWEMGMYEGEVRPSIDVVEKLFALSGYRPELLRKMLDDLSFKFDLTPETVDDVAITIFDKMILDSKQSFLRQINSLPPLQAAVITVMAAEGIHFAPFRPNTVDLYDRQCKQLSRLPIVIDVSQIQYALEALREKTLIWKSSRGVYAIEDAQHLNWLASSCVMDVEPHKKSTKKRKP